MWHFSIFIIQYIYFFPLGLIKTCVNHPLDWLLQNISLWVGKPLLLLNAEALQMYLFDLFYKFSGAIQLSECIMCSTLSSFGINLFVYSITKYVLNKFQYDTAHNSLPDRTQISFIFTYSIQKKCIYAKGQKRFRVILVSLYICYFTDSLKFNLCSKRSLFNQSQEDHTKFKS